MPFVAESPSGTHLRILDVAKSALSDAKTVGEVRSISDKAIGLVAHARQASDRELEAEATAIRMEAERRLGQIQQQKRQSA